MKDFPLSHTRLYRILSGMKSRCNNPKDQHYKWYGEKGIFVCDEWSGENGVQNFIEWSLSNGYDDTLTIDRIDSEKGYSPDNCQWVTDSVNSMRVSSREYEGDYMDLSVSEKVHIIMNRTGKNMTELASATDQSRQNLTNKMSRGNFTEKDIFKIAEALNCTVKIEFTLPDGSTI